MNAEIHVPATPALWLPDFTPEHYVFIDFEAYFDKGYSLAGSTTADYVRDPRWEMLCVGVKIDDEPAVLAEHDEFKEWAATWPWAKTAVGAHSPSFEPLICGHHYGIYPGFWFDTISMAHALGLEGSLRFLMDHFGVGQKGTELEGARGKHRKDFTPGEWEAFSNYCLGDVEGCAAVFKKMNALFDDGGFPEAELHLIDATIRMFSQPQLLLDEPMLRAYMVEEKQRKADLLARCGLDRKSVGSNEKLAAAFRELGVEPPRKISPTTKQEVYAFARDDVGMMALLEHELDDVRFLAEARIAVKSTINESRGERFLQLGKGGRPMSVQLNYYGAHTGRWSGSGKANFQNLERVQKKDPTKGKLKKSLVAPAGYKVVAVDSGQIEARGVSWLSEHKTMTEAWAQNRDLYSEFASTVYGRHVDRKKNPDDETPGYIAKTCFAAETLVLTEKRGYVKIVGIGLVDRLWDGVEWVSHSGLMDQGEREVLEAYGISATPDHEILTGHSWREWSGVLKDPSLFQSALSLVGLPSSSGSGGATQTAGSPTIQSSSASAAGGDSSTDRTSAADVRLSATGARRSPRIGPDSTNTAMRWLTTFIASVCSLFSRLASPDATTPRTRITATTVAEGFSSGSLGESTEEIFYGSSSRSRVGTFRGLSSIGSITIAGTNPGTSASLPDPSISRTNATSETYSSGLRVSRRRTRVYDLLSVGPRRRFTIMSSAGPLIVSNCLLGLGYGQGGSKLGENFLKGTKGPPVQFTMTEVDVMGVDLDEFCADERKMKVVETMLSRLTLEDRTIHCAVADHLVKTYRKTNAPIPEFWRFLGSVIEAMDEGLDGYFGPNDCLAVEKDKVLLPNGLALHYPELRQSQRSDYPDEDWDDEETAWRRKGYSYFNGQKRVRIYGGHLLENICQALARIVVAEQMLHVKAVTGYRPCLSTHDEWAYVAPDSEAQALRDFVIQTMKIPPTWAKGWPLNAEGGFGQSYGGAK